MNKGKALLILWTLLMISSASVCFGENCAHRSVKQISPKSDKKEMSRKIQKQIRRQYWYYLNDAELLYQAYIDFDDRIINFYFHRNTVGTFFTIASSYYEKMISEVNTLVRLGNGKSSNYKDNPLLSIEPFSLTIRNNKGEQKLLIINEYGVNFNDKKSTKINEEEDMEKCGINSDKYLRERYWYYLNRAQLVYISHLSAQNNNYTLLTYVNVVGTFLVITSCSNNEEEIIQVNTFVRLGKGSIKPQIYFTSSDQ